ncbi:hypothetical protein INR49_023418, partial [Caranx melampygus]
MLLSITSDNSGLLEASAANVIKSFVFINVTPETLKPDGRPRDCGRRLGCCGDPGTNTSVRPLCPVSPMMLSGSPGCTSHHHELEKRQRLSGLWKWPTNPTTLTEAMSWNCQSTVQKAEFASAPVLFLPLTSSTCLLKMATNKLWFVLTRTLLMASCACCMRALFVGVLSDS